MSRRRDQPPQCQSVKATEHALLEGIYYLKQATKYHEQKINAMHIEINEDSSSYRKIKGLI
jgi:hypothetical protein